MSVATRPHWHGSGCRSYEHHPSAHSLIAAISDALRQSGYGQLRTLELQCDGDSVTLVGRVPTYFLKQLAQTTAMSVSGVGGVNNQIRVAGHP